MLFSNQINIKYTIFHFKNAEGVVVGCGQPGRSDGLEPCSASRRGVLYPRGTATTQDQYTKPTWTKTRSFCDDTTFFFICFTISANTSMSPTGHAEVFDRVTRRNAGKRLSVPVLGDTAFAVF